MILPSLVLFSLPGAASPQLFFPPYVFISAFHFFPCFALKDGHNRQLLVVRGGPFPALLFSRLKRLFLFFRQLTLLYFRFGPYGIFSYAHPALSPRFFANPPLLGDKTFPLCPERTSRGLHLVSGAMWPIFVFPRDPTLKPPLYFQPGLRILLCRSPPCHGPNRSFFLGWLFFHARPCASFSLYNSPSPPGCPPFPGRLPGIAPDKIAPGIFARPVSITSSRPPCSHPFPWHS